MCLSPSMLCMCGMDGKTSSHLLLHCAFARSIWNRFIEGLNVTWVMPESYMSLISCWGGAAVSMNDFVRDWRLGLLSPRLVSSSYAKSWAPPLSCFVKLNFDGSARGNPEPAGFGGIICDETSFVL